MHPGIFQRPDSPYWWATYPDGRGGSARRSTRVKIQDDPDARLAAEVRSAWIADQAPITEPTFDDLMLAYLAKPMNPRTLQRRTCAARVLFPFFTGRPLTSLAPRDVRDYIAARKSRGVGNGSINVELQVMSSALRWGEIEKEWAVSNPFRSRFLPPVAPRTRVLTYEEASRLIEAAEARSDRIPWLADIIRVCLHTGLRPSEATELTWDRVDLIQRLISFRHGDQKSGRAGAVPLNETARAALVSRARFRATYCPDAPRVFVYENGRAVARFSRQLESAAKSVGIEDLHPHDLRRTCGSWMIRAGIPIAQISLMLRHSNIVITQQVYAHLRPQDVADAAAVLDLIGTKNTNVTDTYENIYR